MFGLGVWELAIVLIIVLVIFGAGKLPQIGAGLGKGIKNFKESVKDEDKAIDDKAQKESEEEKKDV
ncbi:twin-arginine translocase TatA/TatE family subunit [Desulfurispira natronophila]|uniref:Sec-independent protein translocase protein TatA n=1 Tax=Desulfurispira natronophila TaxID=682562 RepID=A0A7W7Y3E1_9BACT|nr:twin-arginine translocase TatA/TatE family subunit [Desulfurispira natronophila]MBB5021328.1 sec-independent protein translocase protein TatA [Desulfurispira natronophila]